MFSPGSLVGRSHNRQIVDAAGISAKDLVESPDSGVIEYDEMNVNLIGMITGVSHPRFTCLCSSKQRQRQLIEDFPEAVMMGRANFLCNQDPQNRTADLSIDPPRQRVPTARGGKWYPATVKYVLENPLYRGVMGIRMKA